MSLRRRMVGADQDIGEALVVAQRDVVAGLQLLDEIGLEQQRLGVRFGGDEHHRMRLRDHARDAARLALGRHIGGDALLDRARLADIEHLALGPDHAVDARARAGRGARTRGSPRRRARRVTGSAGGSSRVMSSGAESGASSRASAASSRASAAGASPGGKVFGAPVMGAYLGARGCGGNSGKPHPAARRLDPGSSDSG